VPLVPEDLRIRLGFPTVGWTSDDDERAEAILESARVVILTFVDADLYATAVAAADQTVLGPVDQATLVYAVSLFANPERKLQQRQGADYSTSWADSNKAATGLEEALAILDEAGVRRGAGSAFTVDTVSSSYLDMHADWCALNFDANYCDCGAIYAGYPIFGRPS
jgi:hypothetical protein